MAILELFCETRRKFHDPPTFKVMGNNCERKDFKDIVRVLFVLWERARRDNNLVFIKVFYYITHCIIFIYALKMIIVEKM